MLHNFHCSYQNSQEIKHWKMILKKKNAFDRSVSQTPLLAAHVICVLLYVRLPGVQPRAAAGRGRGDAPRGHSSTNIAILEAAAAPLTLHLLLQLSHGRLGPGGASGIHGRLPPASEQTTLARRGLLAKLSS